jgi:ribokinase
VPIEQMFAHDLVIVDTDDPKLRQLIVDLPMHVAPRTRLLGTLTYLAELPPEHGLDLALRHDYLAGHERELCYLTGTDSLDTAIRQFQDEMILSQTRFAVINRGKAGCAVFDRHTHVDVPAYEVNIVDTTGAGDAFAAGVAIGILERRGLAEVGRLANTLWGLTTRAVGTRTALPARDEIDQIIEQQRETEIK